MNKLDGGGTNGLAGMMYSIFVQLYVLTSDSRMQGRLCVDEGKSHSHLMGNEL
ncbi:hypothetical protein N431DRAFT_436803 [Stipitochalara longipes BDJ]|nr:hypothetical protein N431DRAFT_436803 [Stipitochalara longipes BDJ]